MAAQEHSNGSLAVTKGMLAGCMLRGHACSRQIGSCCGGLVLAILEGSGLARLRMLRAAPTQACNLRAHSKHTGNAPGRCRMRAKRGAHSLEACRVRAKRGAHSLEACRVLCGSRCTRSSCGSGRSSSCKSSAGLLRLPLRMARSGYST
jgi:hypothetical protein